MEPIYVGNSSAFVKFLHREDAKKYYQVTENGLDYEKDGEKPVIIRDDKRSRCNQY